MKTYIIGHKSPDLDSVAAAISYAILKNRLEQTEEYFPAIAGATNKVTDYILEKYSIEKPEILNDASDKKIILVDHNELSQSADNMEKANIVEVLDHHKINFNYSEPIEFKVFPCGSTNSIIYNMYKMHNLELTESLAGLMLAAILDDTVITKSPTCTEVDKEIIEKLAKEAGIEDWKKFGMENFKVKSSVSDLSVEEIIKSDYKDFNFKQGKFGVGQIETVDLKELENREEEIIEKLNKIKKEENYHSVILFLTDIINEGSKFLIVSDNEKEIEEAFGTKIENNRTYIEGIVSRKKQVAPVLMKKFD
jgi:manganese-dependent inorganic pyrophosphatase